MQYTMQHILYADCEDILNSGFISVPHRDASCKFLFTTDGKIHDVV